MGENKLILKFNKFKNNKKNRFLLIASLSLFLFNGCAVVSAGLAGAGQGLANASHNPPKQQQHCAPDLLGGYYCQ